MNYAFKGHTPENRRPSYARFLKFYPGDRVVAPRGWSNGVITKVRFIEDDYVILDVVSEDPDFEPCLMQFDASELRAWDEAIDGPDNSDNFDLVSVDSDIM